MQVVNDLDVPVRVSVHDNVDGRIIATVIVPARHATLFAFQHPGYPVQKRAGLCRFGEGFGLEREDEYPGWYD